MTEKQVKWLRIFFYSLWCLAAVIAAAVLLNIAIGTDAAESCSIKVWKYGDIFNYQTGLPCTAEFYMALYVFYIILYIFFDYIRCKILNKNISILWRLTEIGVCFIAYWLCIAYKWSDFTVLLASFISSLQLFCPLFAMAILVSFVKKALLGG